jgi:hypothetical protein
MGVAEAGERAREVALLMEGCLSLILIHGDPGYAAAAGRAARRLVAGAGAGADLPLPVSPVRHT